MLLATVAPAGAAWRDLQRSPPPPPVAATVATDPPVADPVAAVPEEVPAAAAEESAESRPAAAEDPCAEDGADGGTDGGTDGEFAKPKVLSITEIDPFIRTRGEPGRNHPCERRLDDEPFQPRCFATTTFTWKAAGYCHKPLYFEHWNLERYGHSHGFVADSFLSAAHFFARIPALPYQMGVELPWECVYPVGYYRPGSCAPWTVPAVPVSARGFAVGAATATGIVFLLP